MGLALSALKLLPRGIRHRLILRSLRIDEEAVSGLEIKVAETVQEYLNASRLLHDMYLARGIIEAHPSGVRVTAELASPDTVVFVAKAGEDVVGTVSLIPDSRLGLPMDAIYGAELDGLRSRGLKLAEVGALCVAPRLRRSGLAFLLNKIMALSAGVMGIDQLVIAVHPKVEDLYSAILFQRFGPVRGYPRLSASALAVPLSMDVKHGPENYRATFGTAPRASNPYHAYVVQQHPQLRLPTDAGFVRRGRFAHIQAARQLLRARPDVEAALTPLQRTALAAVLPRGVEEPGIAPRDHGHVPAVRSR